MHLLISVPGFVPGRTYGAESYLAGTLRGLSESITDESVTVCAPSVASSWVREHCPSASVIGVSRPTAGWRRALEARIVKDAVARIRPDVIHFPFNLMPPTSVPSVLTVADLSSRYYLRNFPRLSPIRNRLLLRKVAASVRHASAIVVWCDPIRKEIEELNRGRATVFSIPLAADSPDMASARPEATGITEPLVLLQTGTKRPHKAQEVGVEAFRRLHDEHPELVGSVRLVVTGCSDEDKQNLGEILDGSSAADAATFAGRVSMSELASLVSRATVLMFPTMYEGFGLGVVEAQLAERPVVASDIPVLREVSGGHAEFFTPGDAREMAAAVHRLLTDGDRRQDLATAGHQHAQQWTWADYGAGLLDVCRAVSITPSGSSR